MSNALVSLILVALMIVAGMTFSKTAINAFDDMTTSWQDAEETRMETLRSDAAAINAAVTPSGVSIYLKNTGQSPLEGYQDWDIIVHYYDAGGNYYIKHLSYTANGVPDNNQWNCSTIFSGQDLLREEAFQPRILDPGEVALLQLNLTPAAGADTPGWVVLAAENGITASVQFHN